jgi:hypothetical protein
VILIQISLRSHHAPEFLFPPLDLRCEVAEGDSNAFGKLELPQIRPAAPQWEISVITSENLTTDICSPIIFTI